MKITNKKFIEVDDWDELMLKFIKRYKSNTVRAIIENQDMKPGDYYDVNCNIEVPDIYSMGTDVINYEAHCKVSVDEFNKFKSVEDAVIWD